MTIDNNLPDVKRALSQDLLSPNKFKMALARYPDTNFFLQAAIIPDVTLGITPIPTNTFTDFSTTGDKVEFGDLTVSMVLDEDLAGYIQIFNWLIYAAQEELEGDVFSDISIVALNNNSNSNKTFKFYNAIPYTISNIPFDTRVSEDAPLTADVIFKFSHFEVV